MEQLKELWDLPLSDSEKVRLNAALVLLPEVIPGLFVAPTAEGKAGVLRSFLIKVEDSAPGIVNEDFVDLTYKTLSEFSTPLVPSLDNLASFLVSKQDGLKIRVGPRTYNRVRSYDVHGLFEPSNGDRCYSLEEHMVGCILPAPETGVSEFSFIQAWDNLINTPVKLSLNLPFRKDRNTNFNTATDNFLPDFVGHVGGPWSLWLAEEIQQEGAGDPLQELVSKRKWCYKTVPYILGYFARGLLVTLVALYHEQGNVKSKTLGSFNLYEIGDRIKFVMVALNLGRVLAGLHDICVKNNEWSEFEVVKSISSGKSVRLAGDVVIKGYPTKEKRMKVWQIYSALKGCPNMEACLSRKPSAEAKRRKVDEYTLRFSPRLSRDARVTTQEMLVKALLDVTRALAWLEVNKWIHRDVRWPNVALNEATEVWTLIDADEACKFEGAKRAHPLCPEGHAPEMLQGSHTSAVDVWGLGCLIRSSGNVAVTSASVDTRLSELALSCLMPNPTERPSLSVCRAELEHCRELLLESTLKRL